MSALKQEKKRLVASKCRTERSMVMTMHCRTMRTQQQSCDKSKCFCLERYLEQNTLNHVFI